MRTIEEMLKTYRINKSKVRCGELEIEGIEEYLKSGHAEQWERKNEAIEGMSLSATIIPDTPRSVTNKFHSVVESVCIGYRQEWNAEPPTREEMKELMSDIKSKLYPIKQEITLVDEVLLPCLNTKEVFIIKCLYIDENSWNEIVSMYAEKFEIREERTLKDIRKFAIRKMESVIVKIA